MYCFGCGLNVAVEESLSLGTYAALRCARCASITTSPMPSVEELAEFYSHYSDNYSAGMESRYETEMPKRWAARLRMIRREGGVGRLLDLGGANGMFARLAHESGFSVRVVDYVPKSIDLGFARVEPGDLSRRGGVALPDSTADVVTMWSCLEHVTDPAAALDEARRLLRPGGLLAIDTPLVGDACERLFASHSHWIAPPEHLNLFSRRGLAMAVSRAGFEPRVHEAFHERSRVRWLARRGRNLAVALKGALTLLRSRSAWRASRQESVTQAGDIQVLLAVRPA